MLALVCWWLRRVKADVKKELGLWRKEDEWPLLYVGVAFLISFLFHWIGYRMAVHRIGWNQPIFAPTEWEGRTGWRKPVVFGISNAMIFVSLRHATRKQQLVPRRWAAHVAAWSTALEVSIITLQAWRGVPSHFNTSTHLDAALYAAKLCGVLVLSLACITVTVGTLLKPPFSDSPVDVALRHGFLLVCLSIAVGIGQIFYGHQKRDPQTFEMPHCLEATAGLTGSPCYEIHGEAIVKLAHFLPLHATEVLLLLAWAATAAAVHRTHSFMIMRFAATSFWLISVLGLWLTWKGINIKRPPLTVIIILVAILLPIPAAFIGVFLAPLGWVHNACTATRASEHVLWGDRSIGG